jgi:hypothetical protein
MPVILALATATLLTLAPLHASGQGSGATTLDAVAKALGATTVTIGKNP